MASTASAAPSPAQAILASLAEVERERARRASDPGLGHRVMAVKRFQQRRLAATYADLAAMPRYRQATAFFLDELYGPEDFTRRDGQFARVVPGLKLFPDEVGRTIAALGQLHALSERLDSQMGAAVVAPAEGAGEIDAAAYGRAWRAVGLPDERERQIALLMQVGQALDRHTRSRLLRASLHLMRAPARAAGLEELQRFLETGFDAFGSMDGAKEFLGLIGTRERRLATALFGGANP